MMKKKSEEWYVFGWCYFDSSLRAFWGTRRIVNIILVKMIEGTHFFVDERPSNLLKVRV